MISKFFFFPLKIVEETCRGGFPCLLLVLDIGHENSQVALVYSAYDVVFVTLNIALRGSKAFIEETLAFCEQYSGIFFRMFSPTNFSQRCHPRLF